MTVGEIWGFPRQIFRDGGKFFESRFYGSIIYAKLVPKFRCDPLRDGWNTLSRNLGPKPIKLLRKNIARSVCLSVSLYFVLCFISAWVVNERMYKPFAG